MKNQYENTTGSGAPNFMAARFATRAAAGNAGNKSLDSAAQQKTVPGKTNPEKAKPNKWAQRRSRLKAACRGRADEEMRLYECIACSSWEFR